VEEKGKSKDRRRERESRGGFEETNIGREEDRGHKMEGEEIDGLQGVTRGRKKGKEK